MRSGAGILHVMQAESAGLHTDMKGRKPMDKCACGSVLHTDAGDSIQYGVYRWYVSRHCDECGENTEMDGCGIDSIPDDIKAFIIEKEGEWRLEGSTGKAKIKHIMDKLFQCGNIVFHGDSFFTGTRNQVKWLKNKLTEKGIAEGDLIIKKV